MNALIVDDDRYVAAALEKKIDWAALGIERVFTAYSLSQAQKVFEEQEVSILISDIEMPRGSGLDLLSWLRGEGYEAQTIFLTNHADFHYAQKAIALQSFEYCLKPIEFDKLSLIISKAVKKLEQEKVQNEAVRQADFLEKNRQQLLDHYWRSVLDRTESSACGETAALSVYDAGQRFFIIIISCFPYYLEANEIRSRIPADVNLNNRIKELFGAAIKPYPYRLEALITYGKEKKRYAAIVSVSNGEKGREMAENEIKCCCRGFLNAFKESFFCGASCCISESFRAAGQADAVSRLVSLHRERKDSHNRIFSVTDLPESPPSASKAPEPVLDRLEACLETERREECLDLCGKYLCGLSEADCLGHRALSEFLMDATQLVFTFLKSRGILAHKLFQNPTHEFLQSQENDSLESAVLYLAYLFRSAFDYLGFTESEASVAQTIRSYIDQNYHQDLNRSDLANIVYLHPDYAARIFKNEMHISLNNYIIQKRIAEAKKLLTETRLPINTVADKVGYGNYSYFTKLFKKETGVTPQDYRRSCDFI